MSVVAGVQKYKTVQANQIRNYILKKKYFFKKSRLDCNLLYFLILKCEFLIVLGLAGILASLRRQPLSNLGCIGKIPQPWLFPRVGCPKQPSLKPKVATVHLSEIETTVSIKIVHVVVVYTSPKSDPRYASTATHKTLTCCFTIATAAAAGVANTVG